MLPAVDDGSSHRDSVVPSRGAPCPDVACPSVCSVASMPYAARLLPFGPARSATSGRPPEESVGLLGSWHASLAANDVSAPMCVRSDVCPPCRSDVCPQQRVGRYVGLVIVSS